MLCGSGGEHAYGYLRCAFFVASDYTSVTDMIVQPASSCLHWPARARCLYVATGAYGFYESTALSTWTRLGHQQPSCWGSPGWESCPTRAGPACPEVVRHAAESGQRSSSAVTFVSVSERRRPADRKQQKLEKMCLDDPRRPPGGELKAEHWSARRSAAFH